MNNIAKGSKTAKVEAKRKTLGIIKRVVDWHDRKSVILKQHSCVVGVLHIVSIAEECKRETEGRGGCGVKGEKKEDASRYRNGSA